jgi:IclR family acetate operon transcriptional repressor
VLQLLTNSGVTIRKGKRQSLDNRFTDRRLLNRIWASSIGQSVRFGMSVKSKTASGGGVKSAERALAILEYFRKQKRAATVGDIASALGLPQSSTTMLLKSLLNLGYLDYTSQTRQFRPTFRVAVLGSWIQQSLFKSGPLTDTMDAIGNATGETVLLGLQNGPHMQYVHVVLANHDVQLAIQAGILRPMTCSALGRMLLTLKPDAEIKAIVRRNNADAEDSAHRVQERQFMEEIESIRNQGFAESRGKMTPGANVIAMLVPKHDDSTPLAIGVGGPMVRIEERRDEILRVMQRHLRRK